MALRILGVAPKVVEKGVARKVGEIDASHLTPLHAPEYRIGSNWMVAGRNMPIYAIIHLQDLHT